MVGLMLHAYGAFLVFPAFQHQGTGNEKQNKDKGRDTAQW